MYWRRGDKQMPPDNLSPPGTNEIVASRVLLVEDDTETAAELKNILEKHGYRVDVANDAGLAQSRFAMNKPDFIILDLILPGQSGFEFCDRIKQIEKTVPILILSVIDMEDSRRLAKKVGADGYLTKPVDPDELIKTVSRISSEVWEKDQSGSLAEQKDERIRFSCQCGKRFRVSPTHRGKTLTCPKCSEPVVIPLHE